MERGSPGGANESIPRGGRKSTGFSKGGSQRELYQAARLEDRGGHTSIIGPLIEPLRLAGEFISRPFSPSLFTRPCLRDLFDPLVSRRANQARDSPRARLYRKARGDRGDRVSCTTPALPWTWTRSPLAFKVALTCYEFVFSSSPFRVVRLVFCLFCSAKAIAWLRWLAIPHH